MKKVTIPRCAHPFVVAVNGRKYSYPAGTEQEVPDEVAALIENHYDAHNDYGCGAVEKTEFAIGYGEGYAAGQAEGAEMAAFYNAYWNAYQKNGNRKDYESAFANSLWTVETFKPKYDIRPTTDASYLFAGSQINASLPEILEKQGVVLDLTGDPEDEDFIGYEAFYSGAFMNTSFTKIGELNFPERAGLTSFFSGSKNLVTIQNLIIPNGATLNNAFGGCTSLVNLKITGIIQVQNGISLSACTALSHDSLMSVINALNAATGSISYKIALGSANIAKLTDDELEQITAKGWTYA